MESRIDFAKVNPGAAKAMYGPHGDLAGSRQPIVSTEERRLLY